MDSVPMGISLKHHLEESVDDMGNYIIGIKGSGNLGLSAVLGHYKLANQKWCHHHLTTKHSNGECARHHARSDTYTNEHKMLRETWTEASNKSNKKRAY